jgi:hypothetical protein
MYIYLLQFCEEQVKRRPDQLDGVDENKLQAFRIWEEYDALWQAGKDGLAAWQAYLAQAVKVLVGEDDVDIAKYAIDGDTIAALQALEKSQAFYRRILLSLRGISSAAYGSVTIISEICDVILATNYGFDGENCPPIDSKFNDFLYKALRGVLESLFEKFKHTTTYEKLDSYLESRTAIRTVIEAFKIAAEDFVHYEVASEPTVTILQSNSLLHGLDKLPDSFRRDRDYDDDALVRDLGRSDIDVRVSRDGTDLEAFSLRNKVKAKKKDVRTLQEGSHLAVVVGHGANALLLTPPASYKSCEMPTTTDGDDAHAAGAFACAEVDEELKLGRLARAELFRVFEDLEVPPELVKYACYSLPQRNGGDTHFTRWALNTALLRLVMLPSGSHLEQHFRWETCQQFSIEEAALTFVIEAKVTGVSRSSGLKGKDHERMHPLMVDSRPEGVACIASFSSKLRVELRDGQLVLTPSFELHDYTARNVFKDMIMHKGGLQESLAFAALCGTPADITRLSRQGSRINQPVDLFLQDGDDHGLLSPLHYAVIGGRIENVRRCLELGADPTQRGELKKARYTSEKDEPGKLAEDCLVGERDNNPILALLMKYKSRVKSISLVTTRRDGYAINSAFFLEMGHGNLVSSGNLTITASAPNTITPLTLNSGDDGDYAVVGCRVPSAVGWRFYWSDYKTREDDMRYLGEAEWGEVTMWSGSAAQHILRNMAFNMLHDESAKSHRITAVELFDKSLRAYGINVTKSKWDYRYWIDHDATTLKVSCYWSVQSFRMTFGNFGLPARMKCKAVDNYPLALLEVSYQFGMAPTAEKTCGALSLSSESVRLFDCTGAENKYFKQAVSEQPFFNDMSLWKMPRELAISCRHTEAEVVMDPMDQGFVAQ